LSRITSIFSSKPGHKTLIAYITAGYPDIEATMQVVPLLADEGCDIIEIGIPFSDPMADGTTIQRASFGALQNGITPGICLDIARQLRNKVSVPLVFMTYYNPVYKYGAEKFCRDCSSAGINGLIIPDLLPEEGSGLEEITALNEIDLIYLLSPASANERILLVSRKSRGFIYLVSIAGVTGARDTLPPELHEFVSRVRKQTTKPLCVGFGISSPEQAKQVAESADGVIIGSRIIKLMETGDNYLSLRHFIREVRTALDQVTE